MAEYSAGERKIKLISLIIGLLFSFWAALSLWLIIPSAGIVSPGKRRLGLNLYSSLRLNKCQERAEAAGWQNAKKELPAILIFILVLIMAFTLLVRNPMLAIAGIFTVAKLPEFLIEKKRQYNRIGLLSKIVDPLRMVFSKLSDQQNITKAFEQTRGQVQDGNIRELFDGYLKDVAIGGSVYDALLNMKTKVAMRKFDVVIEYLTQAHYNGFTKEALRALQKSVEAIEYDLRAIEKVNEQSKRKKKELYTSLGIAWFFPFILSLANTGEKNIYIETIPGKILMLLFVLGSLYIYLKGEEYLSLNLDEL